MKRKSARITSLGKYLPPTILDNATLETMVDTTHEWIFTRTGIGERRIAGPSEYPSDMGAAAASEALTKKEINPLTIDLILVATMTPDYLSPSTACLIQEKIGATRAIAMDIQAACSGFLYALSIAKSFIESGTYTKILVISTEKMSSFVDYQDRSTCILFGDGAGAAVVTAEGPGWSIENIVLGSDGSLAHLLMIPGGGSRHPASNYTIEQRAHFIKMSGNELFKHAVRKMAQALLEVTKQISIDLHQIQWIVPHQANKRIIEGVIKQLALEQCPVYYTLQKYGNTSAASVCIAFQELTETEQFSLGDRVALTVFGGGLTWGAAVLQKVFHDSI